MTQSPLLTNGFRKSFLKYSLLSPKFWLAYLCTAYYGAKPDLASRFAARVTQGGTHILRPYWFPWAPLRLRHLCANFILPCTKPRKSRNMLHFYLYQNLLSNQTHSSGDTYQDVNPRSWGIKPPVDSTVSPMVMMRHSRTERHHSRLHKIKDVISGGAVSTR